MIVSKNTPFITYDAAHQLVAAALAQANEFNAAIAVAVVDPAGYLVSFGRADTAALPVGEFAIDKAYTAATQRKSSKAFGERMASSPTLALGLGNRPRFLAWGGGVGLFIGGQCIGGLGVSGAAEHEDIAIAEAAARSLGLEPR